MPTRGTSPGPSVTPSLTATKLRTALRPSLRCVSADQHLQPHHGQARGCFRAVSKKFLKHPKSTKFLHKTNQLIRRHASTALAISLSHAQELSKKRVCRSI